MIPILYEDNHLLVIEKPVNIPVQEDSSKDDDLLNLLKKDLKERYQKPGNVYLGLVQRLDRPVGGVMVFAKTSKAASRLADQMRKHEIQKTYHAIVCSSTLKEKDSWTNHLVKDERKNFVSVVKENHPQAKKAVLHYSLIEKENNLSLVKINLETGRPHQIRVQFAHHNAPLWGDQRYNKEATVGQQIALWATSLTFIHPITKEKLQFKSFPPDQFPWSQLKGVYYDRKD